MRAIPVPGRVAGIARRRIRQVGGIEIGPGEASLSGIATQVDEASLKRVEWLDNIFPEVNYRYWA